MALEPKDLLVKPAPSRREMDVWSGSSQSRNGGSQGVSCFWVEGLGVQGFGSKMQALSWFLLFLLKGGKGGGGCRVLGVTV